MIKHLLGLDDPLDNEIAVRVRPISNSGFGVYANAVLIALHTDQVTAEAHSQRLRDQQEQG